MQTLSRHGLILYYRLPRHQVSTQLMRLHLSQDPEPLALCLRCSCGRRARVCGGEVHQGKCLMDETYLIGPFRNALSAAGGEAEPYLAEAGRIQGNVKSDVQFLCCPTNGRALGYRCSAPELLLFTRAVSERRSPSITLTKICFYIWGKFLGFLLTAYCSSRVKPNPGSCRGHTESSSSSLCCESSGAWGARGRMEPPSPPSQASHLGLSPHGLPSLS